MMITRMSVKSLAMYLLATLTLSNCEKVRSTSAPKFTPNAATSSDKSKLLAPVATPEPGSYSAAQLVTLSTATAGTTIYYTTDGSTPTISSSIYAGPLSVEVSQTIKAFALKSDFSDSDVVSFEYRIQGTVVPPAFSVPEGSYGAAQLVTLTSATPGATIYYTTDGSEPTTASFKYESQLTVSSSQIVKAMAVFSDWRPSLVSVGQYVINGPVASPSSLLTPGIFSSPQLVTLTKESDDTTIYYTTDNSDPATSTTRLIYSQAIHVSSSTVIKAIATKENFSDSQPVEFKYDIFLPPVIAFSASDFSLKASTTATLAPVSSGGAIETCLIEPALPTGLTVSATDCSISGNPTYGGASVAYTITPKNPGGQGDAVSLTITINGEDASGAFYLNGELLQGYHEANSEQELASGFYKAGLRHPGLDSSGTGFSTRDNKYYIGGVETPLDQNGDGDFAGRHYVGGLVFTGLTGGVCYVEGVSTSLVSEGKGFCNGKYYISSLDHPGLDSSGSGYSSRDQKYYVNGNLANGFVDDKTALLMHMDGDFTDASPNAFGVTPIGGVSASSAEFKYGSGSARFEGDSSWVQTPPEASISGSQDFTAESWVKPDNIYPGSGYTMLWGAPQSNVGAFMFGYVTGGFVFWGRAWINVDYVATAQPLQAGVWSHVAVSRQGDTIRIFVNGVLAGSSQSDFSFTPATMQIGGDNGGNSWYAGFLDDFRITKGLARYTTSFTPPQTAFAWLPKGFYKDGVLLPGLDSAGTGVNSLDSKYYVSGELANGLIVDDKTVLLMHMDGVNGSQTFTDSSSQNHTITAHGNASTATAESKYGGSSVYFDGGSFLKVPDADSFDLSNSPFMIEAWFRANSLGSDWQTIIQKGWYGSNYSWSILVNSGNIGVFTHDINGDWNFTVSDLNISAGQWNHVALVYTGSVQKLFLNGVQVGAKTAIITNASGDVTIGASNSNNPGDYFNGFIDELRITKGLASYSCFVNGADTGSLNSDGTGWCSGSNKYYVLGAETGLSQSGGGNYAGRRYVAGEIYSGFDDGVCYVEGLSTNLVENGKGPCGEKYYIGGIHQPGLDSSGGGKNTLDNKYYVNGSIANGYVDDKTVLLMHMDGENNSTSFVDSSSFNKNIGGSGNATISNVQSKFGGTSGYFGQAADLVVTDNDSFKFRDGDFTIETWLYLDQSRSPNQYVFDFGSNQGVLQVINDYGFRGPLFGNFTNSSNSGGQTSIASNSWIHLAVVRLNGTTTLYLGGVASGAFTDNSDYTATTLSIARYGGGGYNLYGHLDEFRVTKGLARYNSNFTPPMSSFASVPKGYYIDGVRQPGLDTTGTGLNALDDNKYYVNGSLANGYISGQTVLFMEMEGVSGGNKFVDSSGAGRSISVASADPNILVSTSSDVAQAGQTSAYFPADSSVDASTYLSIPGVEFGAKDFKIEMSFYPTTYVNGGGNGDFQALFSGAEDHTYGVMMNSQGYLRMWAGGYSGWNLVDWVGNDALAVSLNVWNEVKFERRGTLFRLYLNNQLVGERDSGSLGPINSGSGFRVGVWGNGQSPINNGYVDNIRITETGLSGYYIDGVLHPGLDLSGSGLSQKDEKIYFSGHVYSGIGSSPATAAQSAEAIKASNPNAQDGVYYINLPQSGPTATYCLMDNVFDGGGWMLMMKATRGETFNFNATYWTQDDTLNPNQTNTSDGDAKFDVMNKFEAKDMMAIWPDLQNGGSISGSTRGWTWLQKNFNDGVPITPISFFSIDNYGMNFGGSGKFIMDAKTFSGWAPGVFSSQSDIRFYGFNYQKNPGYSSTPTRVRWGFGWNENGEGEFPGLDNPYAGSNDVSGGIGMDSGWGNYSAGDSVRCCQDNFGFNRAARVEIYIK